MYSLEERILFVKSYYSTQKKLKEVFHLYGEQFNVPCHKWPSRSELLHNCRIWASSNTSVFLTKNLYKKKSPYGQSSACKDMQGLIGPIFVEKSAVYLSEDTEKRNFQNFQCFENLSSPKNFQEILFKFTNFPIPFL